jgi:hypothetical protein
VLAQAFAALGVRVAHYVRKEQPTTTGEMADLSLMEQSTEMDARLLPPD